MRAEPLKKFLECLFLAKSTLFIAASHTRGADLVVGSNSIPTTIISKPNIIKTMLFQKLAETVTLTRRGTMQIPLRQRPRDSPRVADRATALFLGNYWNDSSGILVREKATVDAQSEAGKAERSG